MLWQVQLFVEYILAWCTSDPGVNLLFAGACLWAATGCGGRWCAIATGLLYVLLAVV